MVKLAVMLPLEILASWFVGVSRVLHLSRKHDVPEVRTPFKEKDCIYQKTLNDFLHSLSYTINVSTSTLLRARWGQQITAHLFKPAAKPATHKVCPLCSARSEPPLPQRCLPGTLTLKDLRHELFICLGEQPSKQPALLCDAARVLINWQGDKTTSIITPRWQRTAIAEECRREAALALKSCSWKTKTGRKCLAVPRIGNPVRTCY